VEKYRYSLVVGESVSPITKASTIFFKLLISVINGGQKEISRNSHAEEILPPW